MDVKKCSDGCLRCYIHKGDYKSGINTNARPLYYDWVLNIRKQCVNKNVNFEFRQCGTYFVKEGKKYKIQTKDLIRQAKLANIDFVGNE